MTTCTKRLVPAVSNRRGDYRSLIWSVTWTDLSGNRILLPSQIKQRLENTMIKYAILSMTQWNPESSGLPSPEYVSHESVDLAMRSLRHKVCLCDNSGKIACRNEWDNRTFLVVGAWHVE
jgi:hypothetical protein